VAWPWRMIDARGGLRLVGGLAPKNVGDESLRIAVVKREPVAGFAPDAVEGQEDVMRGGQRSDRERACLAHCFGSFKNFRVAPAKDIAATMVVTTHPGCAHIVGIDGK